MIWLREQIERGRRHPLLGPLLMVLFVLLLVFAAAHATTDQAVAGEYVCVIFGFLVFLTLLVPRPRAFVAWVAESGRGPPRLARPEQAVTHQASVLIPLRL